MVPDGSMARRNGASLANPMGARLVAIGYAQSIQQALSARSSGGLAAAWARGFKRVSARVAGRVFWQARSRCDERRPV